MHPVRCRRSQRRRWTLSTYILVSGTEVFVQDTAGNILILNKDDLKEKKRNG